MRIIDYTILSSNDEGSLARKVAARLAQGWQPLGSLQVVCPVLDESPAPAFYQAMALHTFSPALPSDSPVR
jgi:hypothetical protein